MHSMAPDMVGNTGGHKMPWEPRILVTGGAGFLGSHLCDRLIGGGAHVICLDNFLTGARRNVAHLHAHKRFEMVRHDVALPVDVEVDEIYNLTCPASPISVIRCRRSRPMCTAQSTCLISPGG
jgi:UDP-glucuronate decarboxylase